MVWQAFCLARTGRPGPVLVDVPKDVQQQMAVPDWDVEMAIDGYLGRLPPPPRPDQVSAVIEALQKVYTTSTPPPTPLRPCASRVFTPAWLCPVVPDDAQSASLYL